MPISSSVFAQGTDAISAAVRSAMKSENRNSRRVEYPDDLESDDIPPSDIVDDDDSDVDVIPPTQQKSGSLNARFSRLTATKSSKKTVLTRHRGNRSILSRITNLNTSAKQRIFDRNEAENSDDEGWEEDDEEEDVKFSVKKEHISNDTNENARTIAMYDGDEMCDDDDIEDVDEDFLNNAGYIDYREARDVPPKKKVVIIKRKERAPLRSRFSVNFKAGRSTATKRIPLVQRISLPIYDRVSFPESRFDNAGYGRRFQGFGERGVSQGRINKRHFTNDVWGKPKVREWVEEKLSQVKEVERFEPFFSCDCSMPTGHKHKGRGFSDTSRLRAF